MPNYFDGCHFALECLSEGNQLLELSELNFIGEEDFPKLLVVVGCLIVLRLHCISDWVTELPVLIAVEFYWRCVGRFFPSVLLGVVDVLQNLTTHAIDVIVLGGSMRVHVVLEDVSKKHHLLAL
jgi:hypothetical protein